MNEALLDQSCRVALAAYLHDLGKFAERARIPVDSDTLERHVHLYCPKREAKGRIWHTHRHAAYSAIALDIIEKQLPELVGDDVSPYGSWADKNVDDSFINAAAMHHKPNTFLQWIVATADRLASGFERQEWEEYNKADDKNHYRTRLLPIMQQIGDRLVSQKGMSHRMPLAPLSPKSTFPVPKDEAEPAKDDAAQKEYLSLWEQFNQALEKIPASHRHQWSVWLDHFDTLWQTFTNAIPSATAFGTRPDVSLYDHSRSCAAMATALWRYHDATHQTDDAAIQRLRNRDDWDEHKFLMIQGDFFGIQKFIFSAGAESNKSAAKLLRGRSFYVSLLTQCAALKLLDALSLPATSQIINAAGKFMILAPNTAEVREAVATTKAALDAWFIQNTWGECHIGLAVEEAACVDFMKGKQKDQPFKQLMKRLHSKLEDARYRSLGIAQGQGGVLADYLDQFDPARGACKLNGRWPADGSEGMSKLSKDMITAGTKLGSQDRLIISNNALDDGDNERTLRVRVFGYHVQFTGNEASTGKFGEAVGNGSIRRFWDFSLPESETQVLWNGYARRHLGAWLPRFSDDDFYKDIYEGIVKPEDLEKDAMRTGTLKKLHHIACEDRIRDADKSRNGPGIAALGILKGDIDNLGALFNSSMDTPTFARMVGLSRQLELFFSVCLPWRCQESFPNTYTVFAGGDDFFLIGPWRSQIKLAVKLREDFSRYVCNEGITFSCGISLQKPATPIPHLADSAEEALEKAKAYRDSQKNALSLFGETFSWRDTDKLRKSKERLAQRAADYQLSTGWIYGLLKFSDMAGSSRPADAIWRSRFAYRNARLVERQYRDDPVKRNQALLDLATIGEDINILKSQYRISRIQ